MRGPSPFLSTLPTSPRDRRAALGIVAVSIAVCLALAPFAKVPLVQVPAFLPVYQSALVVCDLITAVLLWGQFSILRARSLLLLAAGFLFSALMATVHALSFPGLFATDGLFGSGTQTTAWLYFLWHGGFPLFLIGYALWKDDLANPARRRGPAWTGIAASIALACLAALVLSALASASGPAALPSIMAGDTDAPTKVAVALATWCVGLAAAVAVWRRTPHSVLDLWLMVVLCVWIADSALAAVFNGARYDVGWYAGRVFGLLANGCVLALLLLENGSLHAQLASAHGELERKNAQLAEASRLKSEFLANMSHELRTPLNAVIGFSEVLRDGLAGELQPEQRDYVRDIHTSGLHLLSLINDVLDLSKIEAGRMSLDLEPTAAGALFEHSLSIVRESAARRRLRLTGDVPRELGTLRIDPRKTKQILYNLLSNAVKFSHEGGSVTLKARRVSLDDVRQWSHGAPTVVRMPLPDAEGGDFLQIEVEDTGIGIAPDDAPRLFRMFSQLDSSLSREAEGTGLGLALVDRLARLHGGGVALASTPGRGTSLVVWLPWRDASATAGTTQRAQPQGRVGPARPPLALLIEDNDHAAELMRVQLEPAGFEIVRAATANAALDWLESGTPTVVVLDLLLPDMDGWDLLGMLKMPGSATAHIPVVIVSIVSDMRKGFSLGASAVLQKPVSREELLDALDDAHLNGNRAMTRVLLVDDDPLAVDLLATYLQGPGYEVLRAHGGMEGIERARADLPDLIVLDLMMPVVSGFDVVDVLKDDPATASIPIVVVTAKDLTPQDKATLNGLVDVVLKKAAFDQSSFLSEVLRVADAPIHRVDA